MAPQLRDEASDPGSEGPPRCTSTECPTKDWLFKAAAAAAAKEARADEEKRTKSGEEVLADFFRGYDVAQGQEVLRVDSLGALTMISTMAEFDRDFQLCLKKTNQSIRLQEVCVLAQTCLAVEMEETLGIRLANFWNNTERVGDLTAALHHPLPGMTAELAPHVLWLELMLSTEEFRALSPQLGSSEMPESEVIIQTAPTEPGRPWGEWTGRFLSGRVAGTSGSGWQDLCTTFLRIEGTKLIDEHGDLIAYRKGRHIFKCDERTLQRVFPLGTDLSTLVMHSGLTARIGCPSDHVSWRGDFRNDHARLPEANFYGVRVACLPIIAALRMPFELLSLAAAQMIELQEVSGLEFTGIHCDRIFWQHCCSEDIVLFSPGNHSKGELDILRFRYFEDAEYCLSSSKAESERCEKIVAELEAELGKAPEKNPSDEGDFVVTPETTLFFPGRSCSGDAFSYFDVGMTAGADFLHPIEKYFYHLIKCERRDVPGAIVTNLIALGATDVQMVDLCALASSAGVNAFCENPLRRRVAGTTPGVSVETDKTSPTI